MSTRERKARKRAGVQFSKQQKTPPQAVRYAGLGLTSMAEVLAGMVVRGTR